MSRAMRGEPDVELAWLGDIWKQTWDLLAWDFHFRTDSIRHLSSEMRQLNSAIWLQLQLLRARARRGAPRLQWRRRARPGAKRALTTEFGTEGVGRYIEQRAQGGAGNGPSRQYSSPASMSLSTGPSRIYQFHATSGNRRTPVSGEAPTILSSNSRFVYCECECA